MTTEDRSLLSKVLAWIVAGVLVLFALRVLLALFGAALFVVFKLAPALLAGWVLWKIWLALTKKTESIERRILRAG